jgi:hypothetical protein
MIINIDAQTRKPGARNSRLKLAIVVTDCSSGALRARTTDPMIQSVQPIQPCLSAISLSLELLTYKECQALFQEEVG